MIYRYRIDVERLAITFVIDIVIADLDTGKIDTKEEEPILRLWKKRVYG